MVDKSQIEQTFRKYFYTESSAAVEVDDQGLVTVINSYNVDLLSNYHHTHLPVKFKSISGSLRLDNNTLTSLEGCPEVVPGFFDCSDNHLTSLVGGPTHVGAQLGNMGYYAAMFTQAHPLQSLDGLPETVAGTLYVSYTTELALLGLCLVKKHEVHFTDTGSDKIDNSRDVSQDMIDDHLKYMHPHLSDLQDLFNQPDHQGPGGVLRMASAMSDLEAEWGEGSLGRNASL